MINKQRRLTLVSMSGLRVGHEALPVCGMSLPVSRRSSLGRLSDELFRSRVYVLIPLLIQMSVDIGMLLSWHGRV